MDINGRWDFGQPHETGMVDWGAYTLNGNASAIGIDALIGGRSRGYSMARTLGGQPNQVATQGRRVMVAWVGTSPAAQSLPRDLSLNAKGELLQAFVPELQQLRNSSSLASSQLELLARYTLTPTTTGVFGVHVLATPDGSERTSIGVDLNRRMVFVDGTQQGSDVLRAGPLLGSGTDIYMHVYVDHSIVTVLVNNQTALTVLVSPSSTTAVLASEYTDDVDGDYSLELDGWSLSSAGA